MGEVEEKGKNKQDSRGKTWYGRQNNAPPHDIHILIPSTCGYVQLHGKRVAERINVTSHVSLKKGDDPRLLEWSQCNHKRESVKDAKRSKVKVTQLRGLKIEEGGHMPSYVYSF